MDFEACFQHNELASQVAPRSQSHQSCWKLKTCSCKMGKIAEIWNKTKFFHFGSVEGIQESFADFWTLTIEFRIKFRRLNSGVLRNVTTWSTEFVLSDIWSTSHVHTHMPHDSHVPGKREVLAATCLKVQCITGADLNKSVNLPPSKSSPQLHNRHNMTSDIVLWHILHTHIMCVCDVNVSNILLSFFSAVWLTFSSTVTLFILQPTEWWETGINWNGPPFICNILHEGNEPMVWSSHLFGVSCCCQEWLRKSTLRWQVFIFWLLKLALMGSVPQKCEPWKWILLLSNLAGWRILHLSDRFLQPVCGCHWLSTERPGHQHESLLIPLVEDQAPGGWTSNKVRLCSSEKCNEISFGGAGCCDSLDLTFANHCTSQESKDTPSNWLSFLQLRTTAGINKTN